MDNLIRNTFLSLCLFFCTHLSFAQISSGGQPISSRATYSKAFSLQPLKSTIVKPLDMDRVHAEDRERPWANRFAAPIQVDYDLSNSGQWLELDNGDRVWRLVLRSTGALALNILYDDFYLPEGSRLFVYTPDKSQVLGAYTSANNRPSKKFLTGLIYGEEAVIEYFEPGRVKGQGRLHIFRLDHAYSKEVLRDANYEFQVHAGMNNSGFDSSFSCHENVNCNTDPQVQEKKRSSVRIMVIVEEGAGFCTGNLMNNTSVDGRPLVLTAFHCQDGFTPLFDFWKFNFNYESLSCDNPATEPRGQSILGSKLLSGRQENDFILVELVIPVPPSFNAYYLGWDRSDTEPDAKMYVHHPFGDIKKIGLINKKAEVHEFPIEWDNDVVTPEDHHFRVVYSTGYFQPGSSGAALINNDGRMVGWLHGGRSSCASGSTAYFGRLTMAWDGGATTETRLKDFLDPEGTDTETLNGTINTGIGEVRVGGKVTTSTGAALPGVIVTLSGPRSAVDTTDVEGQYEFTGLIEGENYGLNFSKPGPTVNGVNILDMIIIQKHILAIESITELTTLLAADVNVSGSVTTLDRILIQKVIMGIDDEFEKVSSWRFLPADFVPNMPANPISEPLPDVFMIENLTGDLLEFNFTAMKSGDVNNSADLGAEN